MRVKTGAGAMKMFKSVQTPTLRAATQQLACFLFPPRLLITSVQGETDPEPRQIHIMTLTLFHTLIVAGSEHLYFNKNHAD